MSKPIRFTVEEFARAIQEAEIDERGRREIAKALLVILVERRGRAGRPPEDDAAALVEVARLVRYKGLNPHAAAARVTADLPPSKKTAAKRRLYRKYKKEPGRWFQEAGLSPIEEEIERLRGLLGVGAAASTTKA